MDAKVPQRGRPFIRALRARIRSLQAYRLLRQTVGRATAPVRVAQLCVIYRKDLTGPLPRLRARVPVEISEVDPDEIDEVAAINLGPGDLRPSYRQRLENGYHCFVARINGAPVAYDWIMSGRLVDYDGQVVEVNDQEVFCIDAFTTEEWRGQAIHTELLLRMLEWAQRAGFETAWTKVDAALRRSWKAHETLGWQRTGAFLHVRTFWGLRPWIKRLKGSTYPVVGLAPGHKGWR